MDQRDQTNQADAQGQQDTVDLPSINAKRTPPYQNPLVNEVSRGAYGATEAEVNRDDDVIAPTFSDTEPGAGTNYGAAGDPDAPNLGGIEDETTLGPNPVRPPERRLVREGEFETASAPDDAAAQSSKSCDEPAQGAASVTNPATDRITQESRPGFMPNGKLTYGNPQVYGDDQIGRFGTSSGSAGELPGGRMIDLAHGGQPEDAWRADPDFPEQAATTLDAAEALNADEPLPNTRQSTSTNPLDQATPSS
jgi:hypothetical protein